LKAFHLLGSSWGAAVVIEYMLTQHPEEVVSVIFSGPYLSTETWMKDAKILLGGLPEEIQDTIAKYEALKNYRAPAYKAATDSFYIRYLSRTAGLRRESDYCKDAGPFNEEIYLYMWGPTEFNATGTLKNFDRIDRLHELKLPVLFIAGEYDEVRAETLFQYQELVENSKSVIIKGSGHAITADRPEEYIKVLNEFLEETEKRLPANR
ncbi:MAG: alpha/beta fold hydrolase, partial [Bacteroidales bacterium]